jgi:hypothetical protein
MKHFDISQWVDFARGTVSAEARASMDAHLSTGCARCQAAFAFVREVASVAQAASREEPPADSIHWAKAIAAVRRPQRSASRLLARLVYNSRLDPLPAGLRAERQPFHRALYEAGRFALDIRVDHDRGSPLVTLVGQVTDREAPDRALAGAPVLLMAQGDVLAHTVANRFGEFQLEHAPARLLRLCVVVDRDGTRVEAPLDRIGAGM